MIEPYYPHGRETIYTVENVIDERNIVDILDKALTTHNTNVRDINYLYNYYKGIQPVLQKVSSSRPDINNKVVENRASEIVAFKSAFFLGEDMQYVSNKKSNDGFDAVGLLNRYATIENKQSKDKELTEWFMICGTAYRIVLPNTNAISPFKIYTLDPRNTFVVYHSGLEKNPVMGVTYVKNKDDRITYSVYTDNCYYEIIDKKVVRKEPHYLGSVPIIEYPASATTKLGAFEPVLPLLDAVSLITSNRCDSIEATVQLLMVLKGVEMDEDSIKAFVHHCAVSVPKDTDIDILTPKLDQTQTQQFVNYLNQAILDIVRMPNRRGNSSTSDSGTAVTQGNGWQEAVTDAQFREGVYKASENRFLAIALKLMNIFCGTNLSVADVQLTFKRRYYEDTQAKAQAFATLVGSGVVHPSDAFAVSGLFPDPVEAYTRGQKYKREQEQQELSDIDTYINNATVKAKESGQYV